ncbi:DUF2326 domain-containing protein [Aeromonas sp. 6P]|uniref:DUF2326 domain-containing protein n=1 Tax=Aeromonas sp. 6P TaxID=3452722 RepID=UPI003F79638B
MDNFHKEGWLSIRKRILKLFNEYSTIEKLEQNKKTETERKNDIKGTFNTGAITKINKRTFKLNEDKILELRDLIASIKKALETNVTDIKSLISKENSELKRNKDSLIEMRIKLETSLSRVEDSLSKTTLKNSKSFVQLVEFFPEIDKDRLSQVDSFHNGISKIMRNQLNEEKRSLIENINDINKEIQTIDEKLLEIVDSKEESVYMLEKLIELDRLEKRLTQQNNFWEKDEDVKEKIKSISSDIKYALVDSVEKIQTTINEGLAKYIKRIYTENPISPKIHIFDNDYNFDRGDDRGTGKGFANMISLDLTFLEKTCLPNIIHDSLLFKNMDVTSIENLISTYSYFDKQIFISIDETSKYKINTQRIIKDSQFLKLDKDRVAFGVKWKNKTTP